MKTRTFLLTCFATAVLLFGLLLAGCDTGGTGGPGVNPLVGTWSGTWSDTIYNKTGTLSITVTQNGSTLSATGIIGLASIGLANETGSASGTISGNTVSFTFDAATVGSGTGTFDGTTISGTGTTTPLGFGSFTFTGTLSGTTMTGTFDFRAGGANPSGGYGTATVTKQ